jgi:hypothetical protein
VSQGERKQKTWPKEDVYLACFARRAHYASVFRICFENFLSTEIFLDVFPDFALDFLAYLSFFTSIIMDIKKPGHFSGT